MDLWWMSKYLFPRKEKKPIFPIDDASIPDSISAARHSFQLKSISSNLPAHAGVH